MGGKILEFSADKYYYAGKAEGIAEGKAEGIAEGEAKGETIGIIKTLSSLVNDGILSETAAADRANMSVADFRRAAPAT